MNSIDSLAVVEIETHAGELAGRLLGQLLLELETVRDAQHATPVYRAAASFALWRNDYVDARRAAERGWELVHDSEDWSLIAKMAATVAEVDAAAGAEARTARDLAVLANARSRTRDVVAEAEAAVQRSGVSSAIGSRREADANLATAACYHARLDGRDDPAAWAALAGRWASLGNPYAAARARWREAEAHLGSGEGRAARARAKEPLQEAAEIAIRLAARPMLRELRELAGRAMIKLPDGIDQLVSVDLPLIDGVKPVAVGPGHEPGEQNGNGIGALGARPRRRRRGPAGPGRHVRPVASRARGSRAHQRGPDEPRDRRAPVHQPEDRRRPRRQHPLEARRVGARGSGRGRDPARPVGRRVAPSRSRT